jgi:hypothetical protein
VALEFAVRKLRLDRLAVGSLLAVRTDGAKLCAWHWGATENGFQGGRVMAQPTDVRGLGRQGFGLTAPHVRQPFNREGQIHNPASLAGRAGHRWAKARFQYTIRQSLNLWAVR